MSPELVPSSLLPPKTAGDLLVACGIAEDRFIELVVQRLEREGIDADKVWNDVLNDMDVARVLEVMRSVLLDLAATFMGIAGMRIKHEPGPPLSSGDLDALCDELAVSVGCSQPWARARAQDILGDVPAERQKAAFRAALFALGGQRFDLPVCRSMPALAMWQNHVASIIFGLALSFALASTEGRLR